MNILAIDYGKKKIGLAYAQTGLDLILPIGQIGGGEEKVRRGKVVELIKEKNIDKVIVGLPLGLKGEENGNTDNVKRFVNLLKKDIEIVVEFEDERFTSRQADRMGHGGVSRDEKAAMVILQSWLSSSRGMG